jgi:hypothetical protein
MTDNAIRQSKTRPVIFSLLILLSGIIIGAGATLIFVGPPPDETIPPGPEYFSRRMVDHMTRELALTPEQQKAIQAVIEKHMAVVDQYRDEARPKIRQELDTMNTELLALLDENQKQMWKDSIERMQRRFREARERRGPRDGERRGPRDSENRDRFRRGEGPGGDPNSPFFRRRRSEGRMRPGSMPPDGPRPDRRRPRRPVDPNQLPQNV